MHRRTTPPMFLLAPRAVSRAFPTSRPRQRAQLLRRLSSLLQTEGPFVRPGRDSFLGAALHLRQAG